MTGAATLRILHLITSLNPAGGGPAQGVRNITACYGALGAVPTIVSLDAPDAPWLDLGHVRAIGLGPGRGGTFSYAPRLLPWLRAHAGDFDAAVVHGLWQHPGVAARRALRAAGVPYFVYPHGMLDPWFRHEYPLKHAKKCLYWWLAQHAVLRDAAAVLFTCEEERRLAREFFWPYRVREAVVNYGTTLPAGVRPEQRDAFLAAFPATRGQRLLLFLGRIHEKKGCDLLIDAFADAASREPALHLVMAGKPWTAQMRAMCAELALDGRVDERIDVSNEQLRALYSRAEALLFPSLAEGFGWPIAEAQACGCPVVTTGRAPMTEVGGEAAIYIDPDDPRAAAIAIAEGLTRRGARVDAGLRNVQRFTSERLVAGYLDAYRHVLGVRDVAANTGSDPA